MKVNWEDFITINSGSEPQFETLSPARTHYAADGRKDQWRDLDFQDAAERDTWPLPLPKDREGYYGSDHFSYWASGLQSKSILLAAASKYHRSVERYLDFGCASGRVIRHFAAQHPDIQTFGCDINRFHVEWCNAHLSGNCTVFQNHSIPGVPLPDASLDLISAFSVFTHIEAMETTWLMEFSRLLRPGGLAWITVHTEDTLRDMNEHWPLWKPTMSHPDVKSKLDEDRNFVGNRLVLRWQNEASYSSNVFYKKAYLERTWGRLLNVVEIRRRCPGFQDVVLLQKPAS